MGRPRKATPTDHELTVLHAMWKLGPATARDIREAILEEDRPSASGILQALQIMLEKKLIRVTDDRRPQKFEPAASRANMLEFIVEDVRQRAFGGSLRELIQHALSGRRHTPKEIDELRAILDQTSKRKG